MIPIPSAYLDCSVYIYPTEAAAKEGQFSGGSGFFVGVPLERNDEDYDAQVYVVTARHVLDNMPNPVLRINSTEGGPAHTLKTNRLRWKDHTEGDDISIYPIELEPGKYRSQCCMIRDFVEAKRKAKIFPGDEVFMVGRFFSHEGRQQNTPSVRFGNVSMRVGDTMKNKFNCDQQTFLVEQRSLPGYSGSPVFVVINPNQPRPPTMATAWRNRMNIDTWLLGIDWVHIHKPEQVFEDAEFKKIAEPKRWIKSNSGMAGVIPAWRLADLLYSEELKMMRKRIDDEITEQKRKNPSYLSYDSAKQSATQSAAQTTAEGLDIPIPTERQVLDDFRKASRKKE